MRIDPNHPHAKDAQQAADHLKAAGVDPAIIAQVVQMILAGLPAIIAVFQAIFHKQPIPAPAPPTPTPTPTPAS